MTTQILDDLIHNVSHENLVRLFCDRNSTFQPKTEKLPQAYEDEIFTNGVKLGEIPFGRVDKLIVCTFNVTRELSERSGKKAQYDLAKKFLKDRDADAGIFVFVGANGAFRFSLVYANYLGTKVDYSSFRRFTYFVSPQLTNKTFIQRVDEGDFTSLDSIKEAFSVERVTNKFFSEFREIFDRTRAEFEKQNKNTVCVWLKSKYDDEAYQEQVKKFTLNFLGRIIFLYFLLRKGWIEDRSDYIRRIVEDRTQTNLYLDVFKPIFFDVFAKQPHERPPDVRAQYQNTPYLNGGLFEHSELEAQMEKEGKFILFSDQFIREIILDFFEAYNFTVDENSPDDQEVSIDPEMLGKVFENTLAEEERNQRGTFYTPREIVHFMVKDAISQYLCNETGISRTILDPIILNDGDVSVLSAHQIRHCDAKLEAIKVLDPAVGSGAFPVEMMQVLIDLRKRLNVRVGVNINEVALKKQLIKNNLYGVDIDPGAIEVAKLRLWLALIVDYDKTLAEPLPNLDFQFRVGNSLQEKIDDIDIFNEAGIGQLDWLQKDTGFEAIKAHMIDIKDRFYQSSDEAVRNHLKDQFDSLESQLIHSVLEKYHVQVLEQIQNRQLRNAATLITETTHKIDRLEQRIQDGTYKLFKPDFHFSEVFDRSDENGERIGGFDIVIANPPYGVKIDTDIRDWHGLGSRDSYGVFISTALKRFIKPEGVLSYIVSDTWLTIKSHKALRAQVLKKQLHKVICLHQDCFDAVVNPCILLVTNGYNNKNILGICDFRNVSTRNDTENLRRILYFTDDLFVYDEKLINIYKYNQTIINDYEYLPIFIGSSKIFNHRNSLNISLNDCISEICGGIKSYNDKKYVRNIFGNMGYKIVDHEKIVARELTEKEKRYGIDVKDYEKERYYIRYEKGGATHNDNGLLNLYFKPVEFYFPWDRKTVKEVGSRNGLRNRHRYFSEGIGVSTVGIYAPVFRHCEFDVFFNNYNIIFPKNSDDTFYLLPVLCSKAFRYLLEVFENHTVAKNQIDLLQVPIPFNFKKLERIKLLCLQIIKKLKNDINYDYVNNEQKEIDDIVYGAYGFSTENINEIESWYTRRYPRLAHLCDI